jgi:hypothetical protein
MRGFTILLLMNNYSSDQIKKDEMGQTCGTFGAHNKCMEFFFVGKHEEEKLLGRCRHR